MTNKMKELPSLNEYYNKLVDGFTQNEVGKINRHHFQHGLLTHENKRNQFSVTDTGEIAELFIYEQNYIDFDLLSKCKELRSLSIIKSELTEIPDTIKKLSNLNTLDLSENKFEKIPKSIFELTSIENLLLSRNQITSIPDEIKKLKILKNLDLSSNKIKEIPTSLTDVSELKDLDLSNNVIGAIPNTISKLENLISLYISRNRIESLDNLKFKKLENLDVSENEIKEIPEKILSTISINYFDISENKISEIPIKISELKNISTLILSKNKITEVPEDLFTLVKLKHLGLAENKLIYIPKKINKLVNIESIDLSRNRLSDVPPELFELDKLILIDLSGNNIAELPEVSIEKQNKKIEFLKLHNNSLKYIPNYFENFYNLHVLTIENNPLPIPDPSFHELTSSEKIQSLLFIQSSPLLPLKQAKILVVGDERVGKTSVINRLLGNRHNENQTSTQGIDISELNIGEFLVNIWDFAGQELTHQTHQFFLTERSLYLYVLDAQKEDNQARDLHWLSTIKSYSADSPIIVVVNHCDQNVNYTFDIERYLDEFNIVKVVRTSACNLNTLNNDIKAVLGDSISKLYQSIENELPRLPGIERELPLSWHNVKNSLEELKKTSNVIEKDLFESECEKSGINAKPLQDALLKILNSIGTVVAYPNDFRLRLTQILKPQWVTNAVYKIIRSTSITQGIYSEEIISKILCKDYTHSHQQWLIDLLIKFELGFRLPDNQQLLIPMKLHTAMPSYDKTKYQRGLNIRFNYHRRGLLKQNVMPQLIVRMHNYIDDNTSKYWRHGMFIKLNDCQGVIISDEPNQCIDVYLSHRSDDGRILLSWIRSNLAKIESAHTKASKDGALPYIEQIALFDDSYSHIIGHTDYQRVERANSKNILTINLEVKDPLTGNLDDKDFNVAELLGLYRNSDSGEFKLTKFLYFLRNTLLRLTETRLRIIAETEDDTNDRLRESLRAGGYLVADQSRGGVSGSKQNTGERDLVILNEFGQQACIIEAMILKSFNRKIIEEHYAKLSKNYNTHGNPNDFLITYGKVKSTDRLWQNYRTIFSEFNDFSSTYTDKDSLRLGFTEVKDEDSQITRRIIHILINFGVIG